ncbi:MAG: AAA family ATPase [Gemmatimonas sp.]
MIKLQITDFSCIEAANFEIGGFTVLIGPQASGKSVISKLSYFFVEQLRKQYQFVYEQKSYEEYVTSIKARFSEWFPPSAWGNKKFKIQFEVGSATITLTRVTYKKELRDQVKVASSPAIQDAYASLESLAASLRNKFRKEKSHRLEIELRWEIQRASEEILRKSQAEDFVSYQTYIPAGRAFFTTIGRALMAFDHVSALDPITIAFGRLYTSIHDELRHSIRRVRASKGLEDALFDLLGGAVEWENDRAFVRLHDNRLVPYSALSSGQQELLPLILALRYIGDDRRAEKGTEGHLIYIEEPEAHLFPRAQSELVQRLVSIVANSERRLLITTHSPYVLSKINNLILAGNLESALQSEKLNRLDEVVRKQFRIRSGLVKAYAIVDGKLASILDDSGLIDAEYLDSVSGDIGDEFTSLLGIQAR